MGMEVSVQARQVGRAVGDNRFISSVEPCEVASARRASILDLHSEDAVLGPSASFPFPFRASSLVTGRNQGGEGADANSLRD